VVFCCDDQPPPAVAGFEQRGDGLLLEGTAVADLLELGSADLAEHMRVVAETPLVAPPHLIIPPHYKELLGAARHLSLLEKQRLLSPEILADMPQETLDSLCASLEGSAQAMDLLEEKHRLLADEVMNTVAGGLLARLKKLPN
jgi:hypothetical protein